MKRIIVDFTTRTEHHTKSGSTYLIDERLERSGGNTYLNRRYVGHPSISAVRTIIMPDWNLWVMFWEGHGAPHDIACYMHMARMIVEPQRITIEDLYLDVVLWRTGRWSVLDVNEFRAAIAEGELSQEQILASLDGLERACALVERAGLGLEAHLSETLMVK